MKRTRGLTRFALATFLAGTLAACATSGRPPIEYRAFSDADVGALAVGMSLADVRARLGAPHRTFEMDMGQDTDTPWTGFVLEYDAARDPHYTAIEVPTVNRLVFALVRGDTLLNHWDAQATAVVAP